MKKSAKRSKHGIAVTGSWLPVPLDFLRSRACAELSPLALKMLLDALSMLGPNATKNGDLSLAPKLLEVRGWTSRASISAAVKELEESGLLIKTRQGSRLDCSLFAVTLYPLNCDLDKLDVSPGCYRQSDWMGDAAALSKAPSQTKPAVWRRARKLKMVAPPRNEVTTHCSATVQSKTSKP